MASVQNGILRLSDMKDGQTGDFFALLVDKELRQTKAGKPFYCLTLRDRVRKVAVRIWNDSEFFVVCDQEWSPGQFFKVRGTFQNTEWGPQVSLEKVRFASTDDHEDGFDPTSFEERTRVDIESMYRELRELASCEIEEPPIRQLTLRILDEFAPLIRRIPAATHNHHAYVGGFLEHVLSVARTGVYLADKYSSYYSDLVPPLSKSLVVAGAILHDIGKMRELEYQPQQTVYTVEGRLLGHMVIGCELVREAGRDIPGLSTERLLLLEHIVAAHQGLREWGAVVEPQTIECLLVHYADDLDAKMNMMVQAIQKDTTCGPFTSRDNALRRSVFKGEQ